VHRHRARSIAAALFAALALAMPAVAHATGRPAAPAPLAVTGGAVAPAGDAPPWAPRPRPAAGAIRQSAVQWQVAACLSGCRRGRQDQVAVQRAIPPHTSDGDPRDSTAHVVQMRLGCVAHCAGAARSTGNRQRSRGPARRPARPAASQAIWQVQIGCLQHCIGTRQRQRALQVVRAASRTVAAATTQVVWQLQIGCVRFCVRTTQLQEAVQGTPAPLGALAGGPLRARVARALARLPPPPGSHQRHATLFSWLAGQLGKAPPEG
jgi:hypothetical protein